MPKKEIYKRAGLSEIQDQGREGSCTAFAMCNIINGFKEPKFKKAWLKREPIAGHDFFNLVNSKYPDELKGSLAPSQAVIYAKETGYIDLYQQLFIDKLTPKKIKGLLDAGFLFLIVINKRDKEQAKKSPYIMERAKAWLNHSVALVDYDDKKGVYKLVNSRGEERGDKGYFYMRYEDASYFIDQVYVVHDSDDKENFNRLLYKTKILTVINTLSEQRQYANEDEKKALNFANTMLRKIVMGQNHQYNLSKKDLIAFINKYF